MLGAAHSEEMVKGLAHDGLISNEGTLREICKSTAQVYQCLCEVRKQRLELMHLSE